MCFIQLQKYPQGTQVVPRPTFDGTNRTFVCPLLLIMGISHLVMFLSIFWPAAAQMHQRAAAWGHKMWIAGHRWW